MPLVLIAEDGTKVDGANSFATVAQCDAYHDGHLYPEAWTGATAERKAAALVMATRTIQNNFEFFGYRGSDTQALDWPRNWVPRADLQGGSSVLFNSRFANYYEDNAIPEILVQATCEMARELLTSNRAADDQSKGLTSLKLGQGALEVAFDPKDRKGTLTDEVTRLLSPIGVPRGRSGSIQVVRVQ